jgi:hypothetical protein
MQSRYNTPSLPLLLTKITSSGAVLCKDAPLACSEEQELNACMLRLPELHPPDTQQQQQLTFMHVTTARVGKHNETTSVGCNLGVSSASPQALRSLTP